VKMPRVSVIIPTYNRASLIARAVNSVLSQTYKDFEIIIVDDGSTDGTEEMIKKFTDPRILYIHHEENRGSATARNTGLRVARGEYIAFQDSDDEWLPEKLERQLQILESSPRKVGLVYTDMWRIAGGRKLYWRSPTVSPERLPCRLMGIGIQTAVIRKECFNKVGMFDEALHRFIDLEFFIRLSKHYYFYHLKEALVNYYLINKSISDDINALIESYERISRKHSVYLCNTTEGKNLLAELQYVVGNILCQKSKFSEGKQYLFQAIRLYPLRFKYLVAVFLSVFGEDIYSRFATLKRKLEWMILGKPKEY